MDKKIICKLLTIASVGLLLSAAIFICLCLFQLKKQHIFRYCIRQSYIIKLIQYN